MGKVWTIISIVLIELAVKVIYEQVARRFGRKEASAAKKKTPTRKPSR